MITQEFFNSYLKLLEVCRVKMLNDRGFPHFNTEQFYDKYIIYFTIHKSLVLPRETNNIFDVVLDLSSYKNFGFGRLLYSYCQIDSEIKECYKWDHSFVQYTSKNLLENLNRVSDIHETFTKKSCSAFCEMLSNILLELL